VVAIFNCNALAQSDYVSPQQSPDVLVRKLEAYGFVVRYIDGHDPAQIKAALNELHVVRNGNRPLAIVARTVKGWGSASEQGAGKHGTPVKKDKLEAIFKELDQTLLELTDGKAGGKLTIAKPPSKPAAAGGPIRIASFNDGMEVLGLLKDVQAGKPLAPRRAYGVALVMLGKADPRVVALDADVKNSTFAEWFAKRIPERFVECKIAEQNMISAAAGLAAAGKIPFCSTFAKFVMRGYDQLEMAIISGANIKVTGSHAGVTLAADGPSQMSLPDAAFFRSLCHATNFNGQPAVRYFFPADAVSCYRLTELMANLDGCCYLRTLRADLPLLYKVDDTGFEVGGFRVLREGKDACLVASGYMVHECLKAADELAKSGKKATVIDAYSMPLRAKELLDVAARSGGKIIVVEDNYTGGLDAELAMAIASSGAKIRLKSLHVARVPKSGREPDDVLKYLDLDVKAIVKAA
jgi:transketolase